MSFAPNPWPWGLYPGKALSYQLLWREPKFQFLYLIISHIFFSDIERNKLKSFQIKISSLTLSSLVFDESDEFDRVTVCWKSRQRSTPIFLLLSTEEVHIILLYMLMWWCNSSTTIKLIATKTPVSHLFIIYSFRIIEHRKFYDHPTLILNYSLNTKFIDLNFVNFVLKPFYSQTN